MRITLFIGIAMFCTALLNAQSAEEEMIRLKQEVEGVVVEQPVEEPTAGEKVKPGHWNFSVGTSYSYMKGYGSGMMFYTAPSYTLSLNNRWALHGGVVASHYQGLNYTQPGENLFPGSVSSLAIFASASYRMNDRLVLHGTGIKQLVSAPITPFTPYPMDDLSLGATYKIGENMTIGASVHIRNGNGTYSTPFGSPFFPSSFGW
ncbi:MAG: hypothetical protein KAS82_09780 [Bacteroidales bacterium]|nr:hypothetical protein [Bacteroidales bacterium]